MYTYEQKKNKKAAAAAPKIDWPFSAARQRGDPYAGTPLYVSAPLADRIRDGFGLDAERVAIPCGGKRGLQ